MDSLLLHVCCGPCSTVPLRLLTDAEAPFSVLFDNPNIQPAAEYEHRRTTFVSLAETLGVEFTCGSYEPDQWDAAIGERAGVYPLIEGDTSFESNRARRKERCRACYAFRFERLARHAGEHGFSAIATTLSVSPYQFISVMAEELAKAASRSNITCSFADYRDRYPETVQRSRELGLYRQNYCGCRWSQTEAELERTARKAARQRKMSEHNA
jgi:predicted adenine nucleotide alpha hydrolase (AANH) superfamily ATPase